MIFEYLENRDSPVYTQMFRSQGFKQRVNEGFKRVKNVGAESGFAILHEGDHLMISDLVLGGKIPDYSDIAYGMDAVVPYLLTDEDDEMIYEKYGLDNSVKLIGRFHFHPWVGALGKRYSQIDIEAYDDLLQNHQPEPITTDPKLVFGLFTEPVKDDTKSLGGLFAFQGSSVNSLYQNEQFSLMTWEKQAEILRQSGFKVGQMDLSGGIEIVSRRSLSRFPKILFGSN